ncbi:MAG: response regulator [Ignavibacteriae bacterium]|nr:response regulator [Ignavibacteriota bacterium]
MKMRKKNKKQLNSAESEKFIKEENKKLLILPIRLIAIITSVAGLLALLFEIRYYAEFSIEIYFGRVIATIIAFIILASTYFKFGKKHPFIILHILLLSLIASFGSMILLIPDSILINSLILALLIFTSALFLGWEVQHQIILSIYYNLVFAASILLNDRSIYFLPNVWGSVLFVLLISLMSVVASSINYRLRKESLYEAFRAKMLESKFKSIFENSVQGIFQYEKSGKLLISNPSFQKILGYTEESEIKDLQFPDDFFKNEKDYESFIKLLETHGKIKNYKVTFKANEGHEINVKMNAQVIFDENDEFLYYEGSIQDITRQVQAEQDRNRAIKQLQISKMKAEKNSVKALKASNSKSEFLAKMNHELRTPMNSVIGYLTLIEGELFNDGNEMRDFARSAKISADSLVDIINNNLDFYKIESGKMEIEESEFEMKGIIEKSISMIAPLVKKSLTITQSVATDIPKTLIGDAIRFRQILVNLLGNSAKFTETGEISVKVGIEEIENSNIKLITEVKDTGCGIPADKLPTIFDADKKVKYKNPETEGAGLGLVICKELVTMMNGEIYAESNVNEGSTFTFTTEFRFDNENIIEQKDNSGKTGDKSEVKPENKTEVKKSSNVSGMPKKTVSNKRILLVEDDKSNQAVELKILTEIGYLVDAVSSGAEAIEAIKSYRFDLVLMDVEMEGMDGIAATEKIRSLEGDISSIPIIALTAHSSMKDRERCLSGGMNDYIAKPINVQFLKIIIDEWLNQKDTSSDLQAVV